MSPEILERMDDARAEKTESRTPIEILRDGVLNRARDLHVMPSAHDMRKGGTPLSEARAIRNQAWTDFITALEAYEQSLNHSNGSYQYGE